MLRLMYFLPYSCVKPQSSEFKENLLAQTIATVIGGLFSAFERSLEFEYQYFLIGIFVLFNHRKIKVRLLFGKTLYGNSSDRTNAGKTHSIPTEGGAVILIL